MIIFYPASDYKEQLKELGGFPVENVVSAYIVLGNQVGLIDHADLHLWLPPGGHVQQGEDPVSAIAREVEEETGWSIEIKDTGDLYGEPGLVAQMPRPRFLQYERIIEPSTEEHIHANSVFFAHAKLESSDISTPEGKLRWFEMNELDDLERLLPHTRMNAIAAIRELGNVIPSALRPEKGRVLVPIGGRCPYKCAYCYTKRHDVYFGETNQERLATLLKQAVDKHGPGLTAQLGYDNDPFVDPQAGIGLLSRIMWLPVHLGFSTKAFIDSESAQNLGAIRDLKRRRGYNLSALVTLTSLETAQRLEPLAPSPEMRLRTVRNLTDAGVPVFINFRPLLPDEVPEDELQRVLSASWQAGARGVVFGAFWSDGSGIVRSGLREPTVPSRPQVVSWAPHDMDWVRYEDDELVGRLTDFARSLGLTPFDSSAEAVAYLNGLF